MNLNKKTKIEEIFGLNMVEEKNYRRIKENLQNDIDSLLNQKKSKIILLIDDFDRIKKEAHYEVLSFINEVVDFTGVNVIFLMDYKKIIDDKITYDFMEKFINKRIDLSRVDYNEIIEFYLNLNLEQLEEKQCSFVKEVVEKIKSNHKNYMEKIKEALNKYVESKNKELHNTRLKSANQERIKEIESQIEIYNNSVENLYKNFENIRKLKNIIKEIVDSYIYIQATELKSNNELEEYYVSDDCIISIIKLILCKNMFYEEFNDMVESISFDKYISNIKQVYYNGIKDNDTSIKTIIYYLFEDIASIIVTEEKVVEVNNKTKIINSIIINEKTNDILLFKTRKEKYLEIIDNKFEKDNNKWCEKIVKDIVNTEEKKQSIDYKQIIVDLYDYILYDAYESNEKTKERISLVNEIFMVLYEDEKIEIIDSIDIIDNLFRRNDFLNLNYIILCKFWSKFKYSKLKIKQFNDKEIIKSKLKGLKFYTSNNVSSILKLIIQITIDEEEKRYKLSDEINGLNNLEDINNFIEKNILILSAQSLQEEFFKFDYFREQLKFNLYKKNFDNIDIDINYIVCRLTRYRILESIISRCISKLDDSKIMVKDYGLEDELEYLKDYNRFIEIVKEFYSRMERKNYNYNFSDMRIFNLSINKVETTFKDNVSNMETLEILESLYKKIPQKPDDRNYTKIQVQFMGVRLFRLISGYRKR